MGRPSRFSPEVRERAIRLVMEQRPAHPSEWAALQAVATKLGTTAETRRSGCAKRRAIPTTSEREHREPAPRRPVVGVSLSPDVDTPLPLGRPRAYRNCINMASDATVRVLGAACLTACRARADASTETTQAQMGSYHRVSQSV